MPPPPSAATSRDFSAATPSSSPNVSRWTGPTAVTTDTSGASRCPMVERSPALRAPTSATRTSVPAVTESMVSGTPSSLLNDACEAVTVRCAASAAAERSLTVVFPYEPVIATTRQPTVSTTCRPIRPSVAQASSTTSWVSAAPSISRSTTAAIAPARTAVVTWSWPSARSVRSAKNSASPGAAIRLSVITCSIRSPCVPGTTRAPSSAASVAMSRGIMHVPLQQARDAPGRGRRARGARRRPPGATRGRGQG